MAAPPVIIQPENRGTQNVNPSIIVRDVSRGVKLLEPRSNPLTLIMSKMGSETATTTKKEWHETERIPNLTKLQGAIDGVQTTISVDNPTFVPADGLLKIQETEETLLVDSAHDGTNPITVTRSFGTNPAAPAADEGDVTITGAANEENALAGPPRSVRTVNEFNLTEIKRDVFGISRTQMDNDVYTGPELQRLRRERAIDHDVYWEHTAWFGEANEVLGADFRRGAAGGLKERIITNSFDFSGTLTLTQLFDFAAIAFRYSSAGNPGGVKDLYVSRAVNSKISLLAETHLRAMTPVKTFGINMMRLVTPHGEWNVISHPLFEGETYGKLMFSVDPANTRWCPYTNADTKLRQNIQTPSQDGTVEEYLTEGTFKWMQERTHAEGLNAIA